MRTMMRQESAISRNSPYSLFRSKRGRTSQLTDKGLTRVDAIRIVQRRAKAAGLLGNICNHSIRAAGITVYLENGGSLETAAQIAPHESQGTISTAQPIIPRWKRLRVFEHNCQGISIIIALHS